MGKNEKTKKKYEEKHISRPAHRTAGCLDRANGARKSGDKKLDSTQVTQLRAEDALRKLAFYAPRLKTPKELADEFYWCDERSFFDMRVPYQEAKAFATASFTFLDNNQDVFNFLPRVRRAQKAAARYCFWLEMSRQT
jgi:hypothetical protein